MNAPTPGWNPDPTGRHEYRYWDGGRWTDDVSDGGATSVDPIDGAPFPGAGPAPPPDATQQYGPQPDPRSGGVTGGSPSYDPYGSGQFGATPPAKSGPSTGLLVGLAAVAVALIAGIAFVVTSSGDDGDDTAADETSSTEDTSTEDTSTDDTGSDDTGSDDTSTDDTGSDGDLGLGEIDEDTSDDAIVDLMAAGIAAQSDQITEDQAQCAAQAMVDELGVDTIIDMSASGQNPFTDDSLTPEQQAGLTSAVMDCIPIEVLMEMGVDAGGG